MLVEEIIAGIKTELQVLKDRILDKAQIKSSKCDFPDNEFCILVDQFKLSIPNEIGRISLGCCKSNNSSWFCLGIVVKLQIDCIRVYGSVGECDKMYFDPFVQISKMEQVNIDFRDELSDKQKTKNVEIGLQEVIAFIRSQGKIFIDYLNDDSRGF